MPKDTSYKPTRAWLLLAILFVAYVLSLTDRMILALLIDPVKQSLGLTDTQVSLMQGAAFTLLFSIASIPLGRFVDRGNRTLLLAAGILMWSMATIACGLSSQGWQLFLARTFVGLGEAALIPAAYSLIPDMFPIKRLGLASGIFTFGGVFGAGVSLSIGGYIYAKLLHHGAVQIPLFGILSPWQQTFVVVALPGIFVALMFLGFPEPHRTKAERAPPAWPEVWDFARANRAWLLPFLIGTSMTATLNYISLPWVVVFFGRVHGLTIQQTGAWTGPAYLIAVPIGTLGMGYISDLVARGVGYRRLYVCAAAFCVTMASSAAYPLVSDTALAVVLWAVTMGALVVTVGVAGSNLQEYVPGRFRGVMTGVYVLVVSVVGLGGGTTGVAILSDTVFGGGSGIRYALAWSGPVVSVIGCVSLVAAAMAQRKMVRRREQAAV